MKNTILFDSGSTKTDIRIIYNENISSLQTIGFNPFYQDSDNIYSALRECFGFANNNDYFDIFFYGAGCSFEDKKETVRSAIAKIFPHATISIKNDLLAAARALFQKEDGIACILGTGANSCLYKAGEIIENVPPLGFILGDEGSGANLGKLLIADILKGIAPKNVVERFFEEENCSAAEIMDCVYKKSFPNRYLASFCQHIHRHINEKYFQDLSESAFDAFFKRNISQYPANTKIGFVGSIAFHFAPQLKRVAKQYNYSDLKILKSPIEELINFHLSRF